MAGIVAALLTLFSLSETAEAGLPPVVPSQAKDINPGPDSGSPMQDGNGNEQFGGVDLLDGRVCMW